MAAKQSGFGLLISLLILLATLLSLGMAPSLSESDFLALPSHDLDLSKGQAPVKVGAWLPLQVPGLGPGIAYTFEPPPTSPSPTPSASASASPSPSPENEFQEMGWEIRKDAKNNYGAIPLKTGSLTLPSLLIRNGADPIARTNPANITVESNIAGDDPKAKEPEPARGPLRINFPYWVWVVASLLLLTLFYGIFRLVRKWLRARNQKPVFVPPAIVRTEDEIALQELLELEKQDLPAAGAFKKHYFRISEIFKNYLGARYGFDAPEMTAREITTWLEVNRHSTDLQIDRFEGLFEKLDLVKFTDHVPPEEEGHWALEECRMIVRQSRRTPTILPPNSERLGGAKKS